MPIKLHNVYQVPAYALSYLINGDASGIDDADIETIDRWADSLPAGYTLDPDFDSEPEFTAHPAFGLAVECIPCRVYVPSL